MTLWNKLYLIGVFSMCLSMLKAQDYYDLEHSKSFALFLYQNQEYEMATEELERSLFFDASNDTLLFFLSNACFKTQNYERAIKDFNFYRPAIDSLSAELAHQYTRHLLYTRDYFKTNNYINNALFLEPDYRLNTEFSLYLLQAQWTEAYAFSQENTNLNKNLINIASRGNSLKYKSPGTAMVLSTIIPGAGKFYTGDWKDALVTVMFVGVNSWQAYRGFDKRGTSSAYGWIFGSLSFGFYVGNIYGSGKAARDKNKRLNNELIQEAEYIIFSN